MILILDLGSSSTRALLYDDQARLVPDALARQAFQFNTGPDGESEDDPHVALRRVEAVLDEVLQRQPAGSTAIDAIGVSAYACSLVCLDDQGEPLTPVYTYADTRAADDARELQQQADEMEALQRTGCRIRANYWPARLAWLRRTQPDVFRRTRWFVSLADFVGLRLFGQLHTGISVSSWTGLINRRTGAWDESWLARLDIAPEQLPPIAGEGGALRGLAAPYARRWPVLRDAPWFPALGDGAAANVGSGCVDDSRVAVTIGSTAALRVVADAHRRATAVPPALWAYRVDHARGLIGGATTEGGNVFSWLDASLKLPERDALETELGSMQPDGHGLTVLPMFGGERSPGFSDDARATLHGLSFDTTPAAIARACMEAVAYRLAMIYDSIRTMRTEVVTGSERGGSEHVIASGGAMLHSPTWRQIIADVTGAPVQVCEEPEATSRGAALLALEQSGRLRNLASLPAQLGQVHEPDTHNHTIYREAMARQAELYRLVVGQKAAWDVKRET